MPKKNTKTDGNDLLEAIVSYVNRNSKEQDIPSGFYPKEYYFEKLNVQRCKFYSLVRKLKKIDAIEMVMCMRHQNGRMLNMSFYRITPAFQKKLGIKL